MFSALNGRISFAFFRLMIHAANTVAVAQHMQMLGFILPKVFGAISAVAPTAPNCGDDLVTAIINGATGIIKIMMGLGVVVAIMGIVAGGLMRATSFGNERRIAMSNTAITCAVVGLVIVLLGATAGNDMPAWFHINSACKINNG